MCLSTLLARAEDRFGRSEAPVFPQPEKGRALVYLLRPIWVMGTLPALELYDERQVWGYLPVRGYIAVQLEPGDRTIPVAPAGGRSDGAHVAKFDLYLVAGRTYVLRLDESRDAAGVLRGTWAEMSPADLPRYVAGKKLRYTTATAEGLAALEKSREALLATGRKAGAP